MAPTASPPPAAKVRHWRAFVWQRMRRQDVATLGVFWLLLALGSLWGLLAPVDGRLFDLAVRLVPTDPPAAVAVVQIDGPPSSVQSAELHRAGAARVLDLTPAELQGLRRATGFVATDGTRCRPPTADGVLRALRLRDDRGRDCPLARLAAEAGIARQGAALLSPDYSARTSTSIPRLDGADLPRGAALRAAVAGRIVLRVPGPDLPAHVTPLYRADGLLEPSTPYAMALDGLLRGRAIRWAPPGMDLLAAALVALLLHFALRHASYRVTLTTALVGMVPVLLVFGALLHVGRVHVPVTASLVAIAAFALRTVLRRNRALGETLVDVDHRLTGLVAQPIGQGFEVATDLVWEQANRFVTEFFDLRRSLMLELPPGATHMAPVAAFGCTPGDIIEKRRDYRRAPYSTALARELPTPPSRPFLPAEDGVVDLITPLMAADQLVGFWAFSVKPDGEASLERLTAEAARYAGEVAKTILRAGTLDASGDATVRRWPTLARLRARLLDGANRAREQLAAYRDVFAAVGHPIGVCDLFGRVQLANPAFEDFADSVGRPLLAMSLTDILEHQCGLAPAAAKTTMRHVMLGGGTAARVPLQVEGRDGPQVLVLRPILRRISDPAAHLSSPFDLIGLILEIVPDVREAEAARQLGQAAAQYAIRSQSMLDAIARTVDTLGIDDRSQERLSDMVASGLQEARHLLRQAAASRAEGAPDRSDLQALLERAWHDHARAARAKSLTISLPGRAAPPVRADAEPVAALLDGVLALLVDDAAPGTAIEVSYTVDGSSVALAIANEGYAMPAWHVEDVMRDGQGAMHAASASPLERVAHAAAVLDGTVGFRLGTELGRGYRASLVLPRAL